MYTVRINYYPFGNEVLKADNIKQLEQKLAESYDRVCKRIADRVCSSPIKIFSNTSTKQVSDVIKFVDKKFIIDTEKIDKQKAKKIKLTLTQQMYLVNRLLGKYYYLSPQSLLKLQSMGYLELNNNNEYVVTEQGKEVCEKIVSKILKYDKCKIISKWYSLRDFCIFGGLIDDRDKMTEQGLKFFEPDEMLKKCVSCSKQSLKCNIRGIACLISNCSKSVLSLFLTHDYHFFVTCAKKRYEELQNSKSN